MSRDAVLFPRIGAPVPSGFAGFGALLQLGGLPVAREPAPSSEGEGAASLWCWWATDFSSSSVLDGARPFLSAPALWVSIPPVSWRGPCGPRILLRFLGLEARVWVFTPLGDWFRRTDAFPAPLRLGLATPVPSAAPGSYEAEADTALPCVPVV